MEAPYQASPDVHVLPTSAALPGIGVLPINAYVLRAEQPVLVDTGIRMDADDFVDALASIVRPEDIRWLWLTHDDADHTGNVHRIMELAPNARLVTNAFSALRMATWWPVPFERVYAIRSGDRLDVGDRTLRAVTPPLFDNPLSIGFVDESSGALFSVDSFGAIIPEPTQNVADVPPDALAGGMLGWATSDSPWAHIVDRRMFGDVLGRVRQLEPSHIFSSHLPAASGASMDHFVEVLESVPDAEPFVPPGYEEFGHILQAMAAAQEPPAAAT